MRERVFISIGSNTGDRLLNCRRAVDLLTEDGSVALVRQSPFYETEPWGHKDQPPFVNAAAEISTALSPAELLDRLKSIESGMGRTQQAERWGPRPIDMDIIFFGSLVVDTARLTIPHPRATERAFVLVPLRDIAPDFRHPVLKKTVFELAANLKDEQGCRKIEAGR